MRLLFPKEKKDRTRSVLPEMRRRASGLCLGILLSFVMVISGACGSSEQTAEQAETESTEEPEVSFEEAIRVDNGAMNQDSIVISVGQTTVPYSEYKSYYYFMEKQYDELLDDQVWKQNGGNGKTIGQEAIEDVLRMIIQVKVITKEAARRGIVLEADEKEDADYNAGKLVESLDEKTKTEAMITPAQMMKIYEENRLAEKVYNVITGEVSSQLGDTEKDAYRVLMIYRKKGSDPVSMKSEMDELQKEIAASNKSFYYHAKEESEAPEIETVIGALDERRNLYSTITSLTPGVVSPVIEEEDGFYLVEVLKKPDEELNTEYQNKVIEERQTRAFQDAYIEWSKNYEVDVSESLLSE
ncbi:MAG: hypothetical protein J6P16_07005 [Eubacterium sp.]|nr:hypothetical protein [Eubacterium sp.]